MSWHVRRSIVNQLMNILVGHLDVTVTLRQLAILASVREADLARDSLNVSDTADLRNLPRLTVSSIVARLSNTTANGMGFITLEFEPRDRRRRFVHQSRHPKNPAESVARKYRAYSQREEEL